MRRQGHREPLRPNLPSDRGPDLDPSWLESIQNELLAWYDSQGRRLPWRINRDAYRVLVSEMMLVQTTVEAVVPYFGRFLSAFPSIEALAQAEEAQVLKLWEGLGYYRRARQLLATAQAIVRDHGGVIPDDPAILQTLPGIGKYIAGAIASIAYGKSAPILEANTQRVMARWLAWEGQLEQGETQTRLWLGASRVVPANRPGDFNQAFMELGALICTPRSPRCLACPVRASCMAYSYGKQESIPVKRPRRKLEQIEEMAFFIARQDEILLLKRGEEGLWGGFWELPTLHGAGPDPAGRLRVSSEDPLQAIEVLTGLQVVAGQEIHRIRYGVTRYQVQLRLVEAIATAGQARPHPPHQQARWVNAGMLSELTVSSPHRRAIQWYLRLRRCDRSHPPKPD